MVNADEKFVRENWEYISHIPATAGFCSERVEITVGDDYELFNGWSIAAEFTRDRLEQIRQVKEEIKWLNQLPTCHNKEPERTHILVREHAALAELKRGMQC